jgi:DNA-binding MarR family transcriptional regulator
VARQRSTPPPAEDPQLLPTRRQNLGRLSTMLAAHFQAAVLAGLHARGHEQLRLTHNAVLMNVALEGSRPSDMARRAGLTRQAIGQLVDDLEQLGYVERVSDPSDGRAQVVVFTARGKQLLRDGVAVIRETEADYAALLEPGELEVARAILIRLASGLELEAP